MRMKLLRLTPTRTLTYNNRWYPWVRPKRTLFFLPPVMSQVMPWVDFLCTTHRKKTLYIHTIVLDVIRVRMRILTHWKGTPLFEVLVETRHYLKRRWYKTQRVRFNQKSPPSILKQFVEEW